MERKTFKYFMVYIHIHARQLFTFFSKSHCNPNEAKHVSTCLEFSRTCAVPHKFLIGQLLFDSRLTIKNSYEFCYLSIVIGRMLHHAKKYSQ